MTNLIPFSFDGASVRVVEIDGEPWFVGKDVAAALGYADPTNAMKRHCRGVAKQHPILDSLGRTQEARVLAEPDVLRLIVNSNLPAAERFERWVFEEVIPQVRRTGGYGHAAVDPIAILQDPVAMRDLLLNYTEKVISLQGKVAELTPKVEIHDRIASAEGSLCMRDAAKALQIRPIDLRNWLITNRWIYGRPGHGGWLAYQDRIQQGVMTHKVNTVTREDGTDKIVEQPRITPRGLTRIADELRRAAA